MSDDAPPPKAAAELSGWKAAIGALSEAGATSAVQPAGTRMALQFELREQTPRTPDRWRGATAKTASGPIKPGATYRLGVRPVVLSGAGNWTRASVSWNSLGYQTNRLNLRVEQQRWFAQVASLHRAVREVYAGQDGDWLYLDDYQSPLLWPLLAEAAELGIALVGSKKDAVVTVGTTASVRFDASMPEEVSGELRLKATLAIDGRLHPLASAGQIGNHGIYVVAPAPTQTFTLAPTARPLSDEQASLIGSPSELVIPAPDVALFLAEYYPGLQRSIEVTSADGSVRLPEIAPPEPEYQTRTSRPKLVLKTVATDRRDWFDLGVFVTIDGRDVPFGPLFRALSAGKKKLLLVDRSYLDLLQPVFDELRDLIAEAGELNEWETGVRISRYQASLWEDFEDLADETEQASTWRDSAAALLADASGQAVEQRPLPKGLQATLRPYQLDGFNWLVMLWRHRLGGILADDMGLGKTLQALALIAHAVESADGHESGRPFLVVAPTSVVSNWLVEAARFTPGLAVASVTATEAKSGLRLADVAAGVDIVVTSYALFRLDFAAYQRVEWAGLILDEAQFVKNRASRAHQCARDLGAPFTLAITGTPMENSLMDLWSLFAIVAPGLFPSARKFTEEYLRPITEHANTEHTNGDGSNGGHADELERVSRERLAKLRRRIRPLMMRRSKELVATELPAKQEQVLLVDLAPRHRKLYDTVLQRERQKLLGLIQDLDRNRFIVFRSLTLLRMLALDASLVDEAYAGIPSSKLDALFDQLEDVLAEGHRALVFSQFTSFLRKAAARLDRQGVAYEYLDGSTLRRSDVIGRFKNGAAPVFLISLKAGGFGLNLTEADYVFLLDPWWNPAVEAQAVDRTHRIGQSRSVNVYRMVASDTIEEKVMALKDRKADLTSAVLDEESVFSSSLTADDIRGLIDS
ncbi:MAG: helicase [Microbacteriaceae bacterium]|nr:helicase [Microbacteriaceae bacterium]